MLKENGYFSVPMFTDEYKGMSKTLDIRNSKYYKPDGGQTIDLQNEDYFKTLLVSIKQSVLKIALEYFKVKPGYTVDVVSMWLNSITKNHTPHNHQNVFMSGVYFLDEGAPLRLLRPYSLPFLPIVNEYNQYNTTLLQHTPYEDSVVFFPSYLYHYVDIDRVKKPRISIAFDTILRGDYGEISKENGTVGQFKI
tara:strand:- start:54 stop:635 length:582 start_codon:yes stop_codon:yes gene_type:complete